MIRLVLFGCLAMFLGGCSLFGDSLRDRADDYLVYEPEKAAVNANGEPLSSSSAELYPLPVMDRAESLAEEFTTPRPDPLVLGPADDKGSSVSLAQYRTSDINPHLVTDGSGSLVLQMDTDFSNGWALVAEALVEAKYKVTDLNRSLGTYYLEIDNPKRKEMSWWDRLWADSSEYENRVYLLKMNRNSEGVYLALLEDMDALADPKVTEQVLNALMQQLDK